MSHQPHAAFIDEYHLRVGNLDFHCDFKWDVEDDLPHPQGFFSIRKTRPQVERYLDLFSRFNPQTIVELGIRWGGSTIFLHAINQPEKLVAIDIEPEPAAELTSYIQARNLHSVVKPYYGIDQADREKVASILAHEFHDRQIDLVVDDASHLLRETRISFETIFPLLRPGGFYVIEDWNTDHVMADGIAAALSDPNHPKHADVTRAVEERPSMVPSLDHRLVRLPLELVLVRASSRDVIRKIIVMDNWTLIQRGSEAIDSVSFQMKDLVKDHFSNLSQIQY